MSNKPSGIKKKQKNNVMEQRSPAQSQEAMMNVLDPEKIQDVPPEQLKQLKTITAAMTDMLYNPKTKGAVQKMLSNGPPEMTVPNTVLTVFKRFEDTMAQKNGPMSLDMKLPVGVSLFSEVMELGKAMQVIPASMTMESSGPLLKKTMQDYVQAGLKDKSIDPIELQQKVEPLLTENDRSRGLQMANEGGVPAQLNNQQVNAGMMQKQMMPMQMENEGLKKQNQKMQGALQGISNAKQPMPQGGKG